MTCSNCTSHRTQIFFLKKIYWHYYIGLPKTWRRFILLPFISCFVLLYKTHTTSGSHFASMLIQSESCEKLWFIQHSDFTILAVFLKTLIGLAQTANDVPLNPILHGKMWGKEPSFYFIPLLSPSFWFLVLYSVLGNCGKWIGCHFQNERDCNFLNFPLHQNVLDTYLIYFRGE